MTICAMHFMISFYASFRLDFLRAWLITRQILVRHFDKGPGRATKRAPFL